MSYFFYIGNVMLPVAPEKLQIKINSENKTYTLINEGEINVLKKAGLTEIEFDVILPNVKYPFATYKKKFRNAEYFLEKLEKMKQKKKTFQFIVIRMFPDRKSIYDTNIKVSLEDYAIKEDADNGFDVFVTIKLKQYRDYGTKICKISHAETNPTASVSTSRAEENSPAPTTNQTYTVVSGDCLWNIAKRYYGNGARYVDIYNANTDKISNPNAIYPGQILTIPV